MSTQNSIQSTVPPPTRLRRSWKAGEHNVIYSLFLKNIYKRLSVYNNSDGKMLSIAILLSLFIVTKSTTLQLAPRECYQTNVPFCYPWTLNWFTPSFTCRYEFVKNFPYGYSYPPGNFVAFWSNLVFLRLLAAIKLLKFYFFTTYL